MSAKNRMSPIEAISSSDNLTENKLATVTNCYYNSEKFTITTATKASGLKTSYFADPTNFIGWDFENTWTIKNGVPELQIFLKDKFRGDINE